MRARYAWLARSLSIAIVPGLVFASGAAYAGGRITLRNETGAVVRIEAVDPASDAREFATVLEIDEIEERPFASGTIHLFLTSYFDGTVFNQVTTVDTAAPEDWIWRDESGGLIFRIVPHLLDRYLLESHARRDSGNGRTVGGPRSVTSSAGHAARLAGRCAALNLTTVRRGLLVWSAHDDRMRPQLLDAGDVLRAHDRQGFFEPGLFLKSHECEAGWRACVRAPQKDLMRLQVTYTSQAMEHLSGTYRDVVQATGFTLFETIKAASVSPHGPDVWLIRFEAPNGLSARCPAGHRLHYQGFCINIADERRNNGAAPVRSVPPLLRPVPPTANGAEPRP